ncbi:MAG: hypothetical protein HN348_33510, partial [Proteobacteria bacterium]|nr:hypothetical protein [Pseudomonadota bacterium]
MLGSTVRYAILEAIPTDDSQEQLPSDSIVSRIAHESYVNSPNTMPPYPWWKHLESNFYRRPEGFELGLWDWIRVTGTASTDVALRTFGALALGTLAFPVGFHPVRFHAALRDRQIYTQMADSGDPKQFFPEPPSGVKVHHRRARFPLFRPKDGQCEDLSFDSPYQPVNPRMRKSHQRRSSNRVAHARWWHHNDGPRPTIVAIHGFFADHYLLNEWMFALRWFYDRGCDVVLFTLPF